MNPGVAVGAKGYHVVRIIWAAVAKPMKVVNLQISFSVFISEASRFTAALTNSVCFAWSR